MRYVSKEASKQADWQRVKRVKRERERGRSHTFQVLATAQPRPPGRARWLPLSPPALPLMPFGGAIAVSHQPRVFLKRFQNISVSNDDFQLREATERSPP